MKWAYICVVGLMLTGIYAPVRTTGFIYEDRAWRESTREHPVWHPSRWMTRWSWYLQRNQSAPWLRAVNLGLHIGVGALVWLMLRALGSSAGAASVGAALVLVHPLAVESVAYVTGRAEVLAALGVLAGCLFGMRGGWWWGAALGGLTVGLLAKESAAVGLVLLPLVAGRRRWAVAGGLGLVAGCVHFMNTGEFSGVSVSAWDWGLLQATAAYRLLWLTVWPWWGQSVAFEYRTIPLAVQMVAFGALVVLGSVAWRARRSAPLFALGLVWILTVMIPRLIVQTPYSPFNEHQWYMALIGFAMCGAWIWDWSVRYEVRHA